MATKTQVHRISDQISGKNIITKPEAQHYLGKFFDALPDNAQISGHQALKATSLEPVSQLEEYKAKFNLIRDFVNDNREISDEDRKKLQLQLDNLFQ